MVVVNASTKLRRELAEEMVRATPLGVLQSTIRKNTDWRQLFRGFRLDHLTHDDVVRLGAAQFSIRPHLFEQLCSTFLDYLTVPKNRILETRLTDALEGTDLGGSHQALCGRLQALLSGVETPQVARLAQDDGGSASPSSQECLANEPLSVTPAPSNSEKAAQSNEGEVGEVSLPQPLLSLGDDDHAQQRFQIDVSPAGEGAPQPSTSSLPIGMPLVPLGSISTEIEPLPPQPAPDAVFGAQRAVTLFERALQRRVEHDLRQVYGERWVEACPMWRKWERNAQERATGERRIFPVETLLGQAFIEELGTVIGANWPIFGKYFIPFYGTQNYLQQTFDKVVKPIRDGVFHAAGRTIDLSDVRMPMTLMADLLRLADADVSVQITQLLDELAGLPAGAGEPELLRDRIKTNLQEFSPRKLVGREDALQAVQTFWDHPIQRLLTITGPGGVGKTALIEAFLDQLLRTPCPRGAKPRPEVLVYVTAKEEYLDYMKREPVPPRFQTLRHVLEVTEETLWDEDHTSMDLDQLRTKASEDAENVPILLILDNLETIKINQLGEIEQFLTEWLKPSKAIVTTRDRRLPHRNVHLSGLTKMEARELLKREFDRRNMPISNSDWIDLDDIINLVGAKPAFLMYCVSVMDSKHRTPSEMVEMFRGEGAFDIQTFAYESSLSVLNTKEIQVLWYLALSPSPRSMKQIRDLVGDEDLADEIVETLRTRHALIRPDREQRQPSYRVDDNQVRDFVKRRAPQTLRPEDQAVVMSKARVTASEAVAPQIIYEVKRIEEEVRSLKGGGPGHWNDAVRILDDACSRLGDPPRLLYLLGYFHWRLENRQKAQSFFERAIQAGGEWADAYAYLALVLLYERHPDQGLRRARQALALEPDYPLAAQIAGQCCLQLAPQAHLTMGTMEMQRLLQDARRYLLSSFVEPERSGADYSHNLRTTQLLERVEEVWSSVSLPGDGSYR